MSSAAFKKLGIKPNQEKTGDFYYQKLLDEELKKELPDWKQVRQYIGFQVQPSPPDADTNMSVLHKAALHGQVEVLKWVLSQPEIEVNTKNKYGRSALHFACDSGHSEIVSLLIDAKADVNSTSLGGLTPLHVAARQKHLSCIQTLFSASQLVDVHAESSERQTAVMLAHSDSSIISAINKYGNSLES